MADVFGVVVPFVIPASTGTLAITSPRLNGKTPKAAIFFVSRHATANDPGGTGDIERSIGFAVNGGSQSCHGCYSQDNVGLTQTGRRWRSDACIRVGGTTNYIVADVDSWSAETVTIDVTTAPGSATRGFAVLFAGDDLVAETGTIAVTADTTVTTGLAQVDAAFFASANTNAATNTNAAGGRLSFGVAIQGAQRGIGWTENNNVTSGGEPHMSVRDDACIMAGNFTTAADAYRVAFNLSGADIGVDVTVDAAAPSGHIVSYLALRLPDTQVALQDYTLPTATGAQTVTFSGSPAFTPCLALFGTSQLAAYNTNTRNTANAAGWGISAASDDLEECGDTMREDDTADPTDNQVTTQEYAVLSSTRTVAAAYTGSITGFAANEVGLDFSAVDAIAGEGFVFAMEVGDSGPTDSAIRVTQAHALLGVTIEPNIRVTQAHALIGVKLEKPDCLTYEADFWKITRVDGTVYRFTSHDRRLLFRGEAYTPCGSLSSSALQLSAELGSTDNVDLSGLIFPGGVTEADLWAGKFTGAEVEIWRASWAGAGARLIAAGTCGSLQIEDTSYKFEIVTAGEKLTQRPILRPVMPTCRWQTYSTECTVVEADFTETGAVTGVTDENLFQMSRRRVFTDTSRVEAADYFTLGKLTWTSGNNNGISVDVKDFGSGQFILAGPMPRDIEIGDTYSVTAGDDQTAETCDTKFNNKINFGGFEHLRGSDDLNKRPDQDI